MVQPSSSGSQQGGFSRIVIDFMMGGTAGAISKTIAAPIERVKLLIQTQAANPKLTSQPYTGILNCFSRVYREEGVQAFWRGNWANVIRYFPTQAINFAVKDALSRKFVAGINPKTQKAKYFAGNLASGGIAGSVGLLIVYPLDFGRTRLGVDVGKEASQRQFNGLIDCCQKIFKSDGITGLYRGFQISVCGIFVYRAFYFGGYDSGKQFIFGDNQNVNIFAKFFFAQFVVSSSETLSYPLDTIRRRLMMQSGRKEVIYNGTIDCFQQIMNKEGFKGFFKGNVSNIWRSVGSSLVLVLYDELQKAVRKLGY